MDTREIIKFGTEYPYHGKAPVDKAEEVVLGILADLSDRRGIKKELEMVDDDIKVEIVEDLASIVRFIYGA